MNASSEILALHGNLGSTADWDRIGFSGVRAIDLWGHVELDLCAFAEALAGPLSVGMERPVLAGYSLGGRLALHALAAYPERWGGAVIVSAHPGLCCVEDRVARTTSDAIWAERARTMEWDDFLDLWNAQPLFGEVSGELHGRQQSLVSRRKAVATAFENWSLGRQEDLRRSLGRFQGPVIWITGKDDERFTLIGEEMVAVFPDFRQLVVPGCGHRALEEAGEVVGREIGNCFAF